MNLTDSLPFCFPNLNSSCRRLQEPSPEAALFYALLGSVSLITVLLNLCVIVSISHFRQLRTPTNTLLVSLAVADLLVGLLVMPVEGLRYIETCWLLGTVMCALAPYMSYTLLSVSLGSMVLISVDRYVAICNPLIYHSKVTVVRVKSLICLCWSCSLLYNGLILMGHLGEPKSSCHGECVIIVSHVSGTIDMLISFVGPCVAMVALYTRVFAVVVSHVRAIRMRTGVLPAMSVKTSEWKAAGTLGIVVLVFLMCFCPYYYPSLTGKDTSTSLSYFALLSWIMLINSCVNPLIYALFYPWFRKAVKVIITFKILQHNSQAMRLL